MRARADTDLLQQRTSHSLTSTYITHQVVIHSGYKYLILPDSEEKKCYTRYDEVAWSPVLPDASPNLKNSSDSSMPLVHDHDVTLKLLCSYIK